MKKTGGIVVVIIVVVILIFLFSRLRFGVGSGSGSGNGSYGGNAAATTTAVTTNTQDVIVPENPKEEEKEETSSESSYESIPAALPNKITVTIRENQVFVESKQFDNADSLKSYIEEIATDEREFYLKDEKSILETYEWVKEVFNDLEVRLIE